MNLKGYIYHFGNKDFVEYPFNDIDGALFGFLSYANWEKYASRLDDEIQKDFIFSEITDDMILPLVENTPTPKGHRKLFKAIVNTKRYKDVVVKYIESKFDYEKKQQYYAMTFDIPGVGYYVSFRGTDLSVLGWEEDFLLCLNIVTASQADSLNYLEKVGPLLDGNFYVGGHSKGGNLALYSTINVSKEIQDKIIKVYSLDGPGFYDNAFYESEGYKRIEDRLFQIVPKDSIVGVIFNTPKNYKIVASRYWNVAQHLACNWRVKRNGTFRYRKRRTYMSYVRQRALKKWLDNSNYETRVLTIDSLVTCLGGSDKNVLFYIKHPGAIKKTFITWNKKYTKEQKKILFKFSAQLVLSYIRCFFYFLKKNNRDRAN